MKGNKMDKFQKIKDIIKEQLDVEDVEITTETNIIEGLGADSLDVAEIAVRLEEEMNISLNETEAKKIKTVGDLLEIINLKG